MVVLPVGTTLDDGEKQLILRTLQSVNNNKTRAAEILGTTPKTLHNKARRWRELSRAAVGRDRRGYRRRPFMRDAAGASGGASGGARRRGWAPIHTTQGRRGGRLLSDLDGIALLLDAAGQATGRFPVREGGRGGPLAPAPGVSPWGSARAWCSARRPGAVGAAPPGGPHGARAPGDGRRAAAPAAASGPSPRGRGAGRSATLGARNGSRGSVGRARLPADHPARPEGESSTRGAATDRTDREATSEIGGGVPGPGSDMSAAGERGALAVDPVWSTPPTT